MRKQVILPLLAVALAGVVYAVWQGAGQPDPATRYRTEAVERGDIAQTVSANGTLNPVVLVNVGTQVSGTVRKLYTDFNARVAAGQVLMELDDALFRAQVGQSEANVASGEATLELAKANAARMQALFKDEYVSRQEVDQSVQAVKAARAQVALARAQLQRDRTNLAYSVIRSPVSGVVVARMVDVGQTVAASFQTPTLFQIAQDLTKMQIDSSIAEADVGNIRVGQPVRFRVDAFPNRAFAGSVRQVRLNPTTQQNVVTYDVVVAVDNPEQILMPGMTAYVNILAAQRKDALLVPNAALRFKPQDGAKPAERKSRDEREKIGGQKATVYRFDGTRLQPVAVQVGITDNRFTEIVGGEIKPGDRIVVEDTRVGTPANSAPSTFRMRMF